MPGATDTDIPECPITKQAMTDPVMDPDGNSYEKSAIMAWLTQHGTSPITRKPLTAAQLVPNRALRDLIESKAKAAAMSVPETTSLSVPIIKEPVKQADVRVESMSSPVQASTCFTVKGPDTFGSYPTHICCVIDTSGSMGDNASIKTAGGKSESDGLTLLDIVKHAARVIIQSLGPEDLISIVHFNSDSVCVLQPTKADTKGKNRAKDALDALHASGSTNLAAGVKHSVDVTAAVGTDYISSIFLLTDGVPDDSSFDYVGALRRQFARTPIFGNLNTFGFGYNLNSRILSDIATEGRGIFGFIPDAGMVGTIFINALANMRTVYAVGGVLTIHSETKAQVLGNFQHQVVREDIVIQLPPLRFGRNLSIVLMKAGLRATLTFKAIGGQELTVKAEPVQENNSESFYPVFRANAASAMFEATETANMFEEGEKSISSAVRAKLAINKEFKELRQTNADLDALGKDLEGQVAEALSRQDWFNRWGRHYLISLGFAHSRQVCNNFKDPGVQVYSSESFKKIQEELSDMFISLPAPKPTGVSYDGSSVATSGNINMSRYYDSAGVCFHGASPVSLFDGSEITFAQLKKGDRLKNGARVTCIVETKVASPKSWFVQMGRLAITPYHPIHHNGKWTFPIDLVAPNMLDCRSVFNVVLDDQHIIECDGVSCVTLGHGFDDNEVIRHPYFGSQAVIRDLKQCNGWMSGKVILNESAVKREASQGLVVVIASTEVECQ